MRIENIKINGFAGLENKEITLDKKLNIIYGKNEAGKSSLLNYIFCMLYGASKLKNGKEISDLERFRPWNNNVYSGALSYYLDDNSKYQIYRDFAKKETKLYNEQNEDITKNFNINKKGEDFFFRQTKIDEELLKKSVLVEQGEVNLTKEDESILTQKITNLLTSGDEKVSYLESVEKLDKKIKEDIGTDRTKDKPINKIDSELEKLEEELKNQKNSEEEIKEISLEIEKSNNEQEKVTQKLIVLKEIKDNIDNNKIKLEKIEENTKIKSNLESQIKEIEDSKIQENTDDKKEKKNNKNYLFIVFILIAVAMIPLYFFMNNLIYIILGASFLIAGIIIKAINSKKEKNKNKEIQENINRINDDKEVKINIIKQNMESIEKNIQELNRKCIEEQNSLKNQVLEKYKEKLSEDELLYLLSLKDERCKTELELQNEEKNNLRIKIMELELKKEKLENDKKDLINIQYKIQCLNKEKEKLNSLKHSINLAKEVLANAYQKAKENITPDFEEKLNNCVKNITNNKYKNVKYSDKLGLTVQTQNGDYKNANELSIGTTSQMYLALRLNIIDSASKESMPFILDETFAFYDDERLESTLIHLLNEYPDKQIIIFSCTKREIKILEKLNKSFNLITM